MADQSALLGLAHAPVAAVLVWAGAAKLRHPDAFAVMVDRLQHGDRARAALRRGLPVVELATGVALLVPTTRAWAAVVAVLLASAFAGLVTAPVLTRRTFTCACFGRTRTVGGADVTRNVAILLLASAALITSHQAATSLIVLSMAAVVATIAFDVGRSTSSATASSSSATAAESSLLIFASEQCPACRRLLRSLASVSPPPGAQDAVLVLPHQSEAWELPAWLTIVDDPDASRRRSHQVDAFPTAVRTSADGGRRVAVGLDAVLAELGAGTTASTSDIRGASADGIGRRVMLGGALVAVLAACTRSRPPGPTSTAAPSSSHCVRDASGIAADPVNVAGPGTCASVTNYRETVGVTDTDGNAHPDYAGWTLVRNPTFAYGFARATRLKNYVICGCNGKEYDEPSVCLAECRVSLGCFDQICGPSRTEQCVTWTLESVTFAAATTSSGLTWPVPPGASAACQQTICDWENRIAAHERKHVADINALMARSGSSWNGRQFTACGSTAEAADAAARQLADAALGAEGNRLLQQAAIEGAAWHRTREGQPIDDPQNCGACD